MHTTRSPSTSDQRWSRRVRSRAYFGQLNFQKYLVHWKGYGVEEDKWRLAKDIKGTKRLVAEFHHRNPEVPQYISSLDFTSLPFRLITNSTDTPDTVPSGWAIGHCASG